MVSVKGVHLFGFFFFFLNDRAPTKIYPLPLHDALPILIPAVLPYSSRLLSGDQTIAPPRSCNVWRSSRVSARECIPANAEVIAQVSSGRCSAVKCEQIGRAHV